MPFCQLAFNKELVVARLSCSGEEEGQGQGQKKRKPLHLKQESYFPNLSTDHPVCPRSLVEICI